LKQIAERLAGEGCVSLRFDKRAARTYAPDWPKDAAEQADFFSWDAFVGDAKAGLRYLQSQAEVDPLRTIVLGHSEGALIAMQVGADLANKAGAPAGLILLSVPGRTGAVILREQVSANLKRAGLAADAVRPYTDYVDLAITQLLRDGSVPPNPPAGLGALFPRSAIKLLQVELRLDPAKVLPLYPGPVIVVQGEKDIQVSAERDLPLVLAALKGRNGGSVVSRIVPSASHNLKAVANENSDPGVSGPVVPDALDAVTSWMKKQIQER